MQLPTTLRPHRLATVLKPRSHPRLLSSSVPRRFASPEKPAAVTQNHTAPQAPPRQRRNNRDQLPVLPIVAIFCLGSASFYFLVKSREGTGGKSHFNLPEKIPVEEEKFKKRPLHPTFDRNTFESNLPLQANLIDQTEPSTMPALQTPKRTAPLFQPGTSTNEALVLFVLGGPGAGKGTQCANIVRDYGFKHLSAGDLLREERNRPGSEFGDMIETYIREGQIVPMEVTIQLLENAMTATISETGNRKFLIDGFPRKMDQAVAFEEKVVPSKFTLFFDCPEETMRERLLKRGETSGRSDDNEESIKKRFKTFVETSMPVVEMFGKEGRVVKLDATKNPEGVYEGVRSAFQEKGIEPQ